MAVFFISFLPSDDYSRGGEILKERQTIWRADRKLPTMHLRGRMKYRLVAAVAVLLQAGAPSVAAEISIMSGGAPKEVLATLVPQFEKLTGHHIKVTYAVIAALQQKLAAGERADMATGGHSERGDRPKPAAPFIPPVWYRARPWDPPITNDAALL